MNILQEAVARSYEKPQLIDFSAKWCVPCQWLAPVLKELAQMPEMPADIVEIDIDEFEEIALAENIKSVPTLKLFVEGELKATYHGMMYAQGLLKWIQANL